MKVKQNITTYPYLSVTQLLIIAVSFLLGIGGLFLLSELPSILEIIIFGLFLLILVYIYRILWFFIIIFIGFCYAFIVAQSALSTHLPEMFNNKYIQVTGIIANTPTIQEHKTSFMLSIIDASYHKIPIHIKKIKLNWYKNAPKLTKGMRLTLNAKLKKPHGRFNNVGFDYQQWLFRNRLDATGYVNNKSPYTIYKITTGINNYLNLFRENAKNNYLANTNNKPLLMGLLLGDRTQMDQKYWNILQSTGTVHLLAISGLHLGLVVLFVMLPFRILLIWFGNTYLRLHSWHISILIGVIFALMYALLAGFLIPTQRSFLMLLLFVVALLTNKQTNSFAILSLALIACLLIDPFYILAPGFWLSFLAVFWLLILIKRRSHNYFASLIWIQFILSLALMPVLNYFGFGISYLAIPANIIALPVISFVVLPALLLGFVFSSFEFGLWFLSIADNVLGLLWQLLEWLSNAPRVLKYFPEISIYQVIIASIALLILLMPYKFPLKSLALLIFITSLVPNNRHLDDNEAKITIFDVGQGLAILVNTKSHSLLYDTGAKSFFSTQGVFLNSVKPWLINKGITNFDKLIISHSDNDHSGGFTDILDNFTVGEIFSSEPDKFKQSVLCNQQVWQWDGVLFQILHPSKNTNLVGNNAACVLQIKTIKHSMLLLSDIEKQGEKQLLEAHPKLKADIILVPHHGSKTSSTEQMIQSIKPTIGIISSGYKNRFHHPHPKIIKRLKQHHIQLFNTAESGAIEVLLNDSITITDYRKSFGKFWHR